MFKVLHRSDKRLQRKPFLKRKYIDADTHTHNQGDAMVSHPLQGKTKENRFRFLSTCFSWPPTLHILVRARTCVPVCGKKIFFFKLRARNNNCTGSSFTLACPYVRGRTCVPIRAWPYVQTKTKQKKTFKQPHRPFLHSRKRRLDWGIVFIHKCG